MYVSLYISVYVYICINADIHIYMYIDFCECVDQALEMGYSHHNIARDLDGTNAARKLVLIARELGLDMNLEDIEIESLLPEGAVRVRVCLEVYC